jgi:hypothetical protein
MQIERRQLADPSAADAERQDHQRAGAAGRGENGRDATLEQRTAGGGRSGFRHLCFPRLKQLRND